MREFLSLTFLFLLLAIATVEPGNAGTARARAVEAVAGTAQTGS